MTALKGRAIADFIAKRDPRVAAVLLFGPDEGLVRERGDTLARAVVQDFKDPFNYIELADNDLKADPTRLVDEAAALSFAGGERVIRVRTAGETAAAAAGLLVSALEAGSLKPNALVVIEASDLGKASRLRRLFEASRAVVALPCYADAPTDVRALASTAAAAEALRFDADALDLLAASLGEDRGISRAEIEKLILYVGPAATRPGAQDGGPAWGSITREDVAVSLVDPGGEALDDAAGAAADGASDRLSLALHRSAGAGASPVALLRALQRQLVRLEEAARLVAGGDSPAAAMKRLRPPVFFKEERAFEARLRRWTPARLGAALALVLEAEIAAKTTGAPQQAIAERAALRIAAMARGGASA